MSNKQHVILQVLPALKSGGVERGTIDIARAIMDGGGKAIVASSGGPMVSQLGHCRAEHITLPLAGRNPLQLWLNAKALADVIKKHDVDIVHARSRGPAWSAYWAAKKTGCHFMTTFHGVYGLRTHLKRRYNSIMARGERVIAISQFIAEHIQKHYEIDPAKVRVIHRGIDLKLFNPSIISPERIINLTREWRLPEELPLILFPARITRWKGQDVFIKALAKLPHRHFFAILLGNDQGHESYRRELEKLIIASGLEGHVRIAKHTYHITAAYLMAKLVVATSLEPEAFGRVVLETQAMGRPIIATDHGGPRETVIPDVTGWLVPPGDVDALASAIDRGLALDTNGLQVMGAKGIAHARQFSLDKMCSETLSVYEELLG